MICGSFWIDILCSDSRSPMASDSRSPMASRQMFHAEPWNILFKKNDGRYIDIDGDMLVHVRRIQQGVSWHSVFHFLCSVKTEFSRSVAMSLPTWRDLFILQNSLHSLFSGFGQIRKPRTQGLHHLGHLRLQRRVGHLLSTLSTEDGTNLLKNPGGASNLERP